jgi:regulator of protease activity HflC (stomatin/prohibitin superfamily)
MNRTFDPDDAFQSARKLLAAAGAAALLLFVGCSTVHRIDAGHVGIKVRLAGSERGVQDMPVVTGWVFVNPITEQLVTFPTSVQNVIWTATPHEGRAIDESITFSSSEGVNVNADVSLSFHIEPNLAPHLYGRFRQNDVMLIAYGYVRNTVREAFGEVASTLPVHEIYGAGKSKLLADVTKRIADRLGADGFVIDQLTINGALRLPQNVAEAINRAMEATQNAIQAENRVRQVRAEADQAVTQANGEAEARRRTAQGEADAILIKAHSEAKANEIIRLSTTATVLQYRALERWDGKLPTFNGAGQLPLLTFDVSKLGSGLDDATRERKLKELLAEGTPQPSSQAAPAPTAPAAPAPATP